VGKDDLRKLIERLPEDATDADVMEELYFRVQVEKGLKDAADGRLISHAQLRDRIVQWRKSAGR